uniref:BZIP domain-containing protein n=1 Tax=Angiostrongylus cantonensis TaxID=6313 RepID=A0A158P7I6_ANGCA
MGNTSPHRSDKAVNGEYASSSSSPPPTIPTNLNALSERGSELVTNGMELYAMLQSGLRQSWRSTSPASVRVEREGCTSSPSQRAEKQVDYLERRRKNNDSARRSREVRRQREALNRRQVEMLERENMQLRAQIALLRLEVGQLSFVLLAEGVKLLS